jgi:hypothetical protein
MSAVMKETYFLLFGSRNPRDHSVSPLIHIGKVSCANGICYVFGYPFWKGGLGSGPVFVRLSRGGQADGVTRQARYQLNDTHGQHAYYHHTYTWTVRCNQFKPKWAEKANAA